MDPIRTTSALMACRLGSVSMGAQGRLGGLMGLHIFSDFFYFGHFHTCLKHNCGNCHTLQSLSISTILVNRMYTYIDQNIEFPHQTLVQVLPSICRWKPASIAVKVSGINADITEQTIGKEDTMRSLLCFTNSESLDEITKKAHTLWGHFTYDCGR